MTQITATYIDHMGSDLSVVNAARVSFGKTSQLVFNDDPDDVGSLSERDTKLIKYLAKHCLRILPRQGTDLRSTSTREA
jgi:thymidylate synthase (FAD)